MRPDLAEAPLVVMGLMGSGKTTIATLLAAALGRELRDSDPDMRERYGMTAREMMERVGVEILHEREAEHLREALAVRPPAVIAAAASTIERADLRELLARAVVVFLDAPDEVLAHRMLSASHRPHFESDLRAMLAKQHARRGPLFAKVASLVVDVSEREPEEIAASILTALRHPGDTAVKTITSP